LLSKDDSERQVSDIIWRLFEQCGRGDFSLARQVVQDAEALSTKYKSENVVIQTEGELDDDSDDEAMVIDEQIVPHPTTEGRNQMLGSESNINTMQAYAADHLFGAPPGSVRKVDPRPPRQLGEATPLKLQPDCDDDGFVTVMVKKKGTK